MGWPVTFPKVTMGWNAAEVEPFSFDNTMEVSKGHPLMHLVEWTGTVAKGAPGGRLKALVINCHGYYGSDFTSTLDSAGGIPRTSGGFGLNIGEGVNSDNAHLFGKLRGLVDEIHIYACGAAGSPVKRGENMSSSMCQIIADSSRATVVASLEYQDDVVGPGPNMAPPMDGQVVRFTPG
jgi:hypothetical protein